MLAILPADRDLALFLQLKNGVPACANIRKHPCSLTFPFGYLEISSELLLCCLFTTAIQPIKNAFQGSLVILAAFDFLDGRTATVYGRLEFSQDHVYVINWYTQLEDIVRMRPHLSQYTFFPQIPENPLSHVTSLTQSHEPL